MNDFEKEFKQLLGKRTEVDTFIRTLNKFNDGDIHIDVSTYIDYDIPNDWDDNFEDYDHDSDPDELPGYHVMINPINVDNYTYILFDISMPSESEYPVVVNYKTMSGDKKYHFSNLNSLESFISGVFTSNEYLTIVKRIEMATANI